jgi:hypothetical protein
VSTYREQYARQEELRASLPKRRYITNEEFRRQKSALTRAINSGDPEKVLRTVEKTVKEEWAGNTAWPDDWSRWRNALEDASQKARRQALDLYDDYEEYDRLIAISEELWAASMVLFP